jgi:DNA polymerase-3 subunit beta
MIQFEVTRQVLLKAISNVNGVVEKRNTIPVLQNIKIDAKDNKVVLFATDMDILVTSTFESVFMKKGGTTTVSSQMFFDIIRKIPDPSNITILQESESILQIKSGRSKYNLPCIDAGEFPNLSGDELDEEVEIEAEKLAKMIDKTRFAISNDETRYYLNGLFLQSIKNDSAFELRTVATDGHRLALSFMASDLKTSFGVIVPKKSVSEIRRIIDNKEKIRLAVSRVKIKISTGQTTIISKLIDGEFPDYDKVLPKNNTQIALINKKTFFDCVDRVSTVASDKHRSLKLIIQNGKMSLQVNTNDGSFAYEELDVNYSGNLIETGFNSRYLLDIIGQIDKDELLMRFKDNISPALIEARDMTSVFVIMPVRV